MSTDERERAEFEAAMRAVPCPETWTFQDDGTGGYHNHLTEWAWIGWQQALAQRATPTTAQAPAQPLTNIVTEAIEGYKAGLAGGPMGFVSEAFDCGWYSGDSERLATPPPQAAAQAPAAPDGVWEALQRLIENAATMGPASRDDALLVARYRSAALTAAPAQAAQPEPVEMSPEFTDTSRAALLWVLWHHQGGSSPIGQPLRFALGMGAHDELSPHQIAEAKRWAAITKSTTAQFHRAAQAAQPVPVANSRPLAEVIAEFEEDPQRKAMLIAARERLAAHSAPVAWIDTADLERLRADKWAIATVAAYTTQGNCEPLYAATQTPRPNEPELGADGGAQGKEER